MTSEICKNESDSDSLPELSELFPTPSNEIKKGDIVWAKFKTLFWPALVRHVYPKEKKVTVWYTDDPGKNFKLSMKNVFLFHDSNMSAKIKKEVKEHGAALIQAHEGLTSHAISYLNRKAQGYDDNPLKFFDQTYPYFMVENWLEKNPTANREMFLDIKIKPLYLCPGTSTTTIRKRGSTSQAELSEDDSDIVPAENYESDEDLSTDFEKSTDEKQNTNKIIDSCKNDYIDKIVTCITSGKADTYLSNVVSKKVSSVYYDIYSKAMESDKRDLDYISYGPVEDIKKLRVIICYLLDVYERISDKGKKRKIKIHASYSGGNKLEEAGFVSSVLLPESIIFAISHINSVSLQEAKKIFHKKSVIKPGEGKNFLESINSVSLKTDGTENSKSSENTQSSYNSIYEKFECDTNVAGCSNKRSCWALDDVLKDIDTDEFPKDSLSAIDSEKAGGETRKDRSKQNKISRKRH